MKRQKISVKETIKKRIEFRNRNMVFLEKSIKMNERDKLRIFGADPTKPKPINVNLITDNVDCFPDKEGKNLTAEGREKINEIRMGLNVEENGEFFYMDSDKQIFNENNQLQSDVIKYFSIIIPTMWKSDKIFRMLPIYQKSEYVKEIIIIDNNPIEKKIKLHNRKKIRYYAQKKNIYVNPSWNLGYTLSEHNLILANDDVIINDFDNVIKLISSTDYDIIGLGIFGNKRERPIRIETINNFPFMGYGYFMYVKEYSHIPKQLKIWYGDKILFDKSKKRGVIRNADIEYDKGKTINSDNQKLRNNVARKDIEIYGSLSSNKIK